MVEIFSFVFSPLKDFGFFQSLFYLKTLLYIENFFRRIFF